MRRARHLVALSLLLLAAAVPLAAQSWSGPEALALQVKSKQAGEVGEALVILRYQLVEPPAGPRPVRTDAAGRAVVAGLAPGIWEVEVSHPDYLSFVSLVVIEGGRKPRIQASFLQASGSSLTPIRVRFSDGSGKPASPPVPLPPEAAERLARRRPPAVAAPATDSRPPDRPAATAPPSVTPPQELRPLPETARAPEAAPAAGEPAPVPAAPVERRPEEPEPAAAPPAAPRPPAPEPAAAAEPGAPEPPVSGVPVSGTTAPEAPALEPPAPEPPPPRPEAPPPAAPAPQPAPVRAAPAEPEPPRAAPDPRPAPAQPTPAAPVPPPPEEPEPREPEPEAPPLPEPQPPAEPEPLPEPQPAAEPAAPAPPAATEPAPTPAAAAASEPAPAAAVLPAPGPLGATLRAYRDQSCIECRPGEWALSVEVVAAPGTTGCPPTAEADGERLAALLGGSIALELAEVAAPAAAALSHLQGEASEEAAALLGGPDSSCRILAAVLPKGGRFRGARLEAADASGVGDCQASAPCPVGRARWLGQPRVAREPSATVIWSLFVNQAPDRARRARLTVYFASPSRLWQPPGS